MPGTDNAEAGPHRFVSEHRHHRQQAKYSVS